MYPNSVNQSSRLAAGLSAVPKPTVPRTKPVPLPTPSRRPPGRPQPARPRRPPAPGVYPGRKPQVPRPSFNWSTAKPGVNWANLGRLNPYVAAFGLGYSVATWILGDTGSGATSPEQWWNTGKDIGGATRDLWSLDMDGPDIPGPPYVFKGFGLGAGYVPGGGVWADAPFHYEIGGQAGYHIHPDMLPGKAFDIPTSGNFMVMAIYNPNPTLDPLFDRGWFVRSYNRRNMPEVPAGVPTLHYRPAKFQIASGHAPLPWQVGYVPMFKPIQPGPMFQPGQAPLTRPFPRPKPWSPEFPAVGPSTSPNPVGEPYPGTSPGAEPGAWPNPGGQPAPGGNPSPGVDPVPEILPELVPEISWKPAPLTYGQTWPTAGTNTLPRPNTRPHRARRPRRGTKETKAKAGPIFSFLWRSVSPITESIDLLNVLYECLPWKMKIAQYKSRGRQPNPAEKAFIIYQNINDVDLSCALVGYTNNFIEDFMYSIGSGWAKDANRKDMRPIGYEAGGGISGGGVGVSSPSVSIEGIGDFIGGLL